MILIPRNAFTDFTGRYEVTSKLGQRQKQKIKIYIYKNVYNMMGHKYNPENVRKTMYENIYIRFTAI